MRRNLCGHLGFRQPHRAELTALERAEHIAEWVRLTEKKLAQVAPVSERGRVEGRGNKGGINAATRELGIDRSEAQRAVKIAGIAEEAGGDGLAMNSHPSAMHQTRGAMRFQRVRRWSAAFGLT